MSLQRIKRNRTQLTNGENPQTQILTSLTRNVGTQTDRETYRKEKQKLEETHRK